MFPGGAAASVGLGLWVAPDSPIAQFIAFFALPLAFGASMVLWQGLALIVLLPKALHALARRRRPQPSDAVRTLRRKAVIMPPVCLLIMPPFGAVVGLLGDGLLLGLAAFTVAGLMYGLGMWAFAQKDLLPLMEEF
jgi:hypothetical protein